MSKRVASGSMHPILSIVVPVYNESEVLPEFHRRLLATLSTMNIIYEVIYINDGSRDASMRVLAELCARDESTSCIDLSRNFGKEIALTAGIDHSEGDAVVIIDADLQDPPEVIPAMIEKWREGYDNVYATRRRRQGETMLKKFTATMFYKVIGALSKVDIPADTGDFRLLSRRAVNALNQLREQNRFMKGLFAWIGYPAVAVQYDRDPRYAGDTKFNYMKLWNFAIEGITSFSTAPLKVSTYFGGFVAVLAGLFGCVTLYKTLIFGNPVRGYSSLMCSILFLGGIQLVAIGVLGEYVGRMFIQAKCRPLYLIKSHLNNRSGGASG